jgi:hypothetical protein
MVDKLSIKRSIHQKYNGREKTSQKKKLGEGGKRYERRNVEKRNTSAVVKGI